MKSDLCIGIMSGTSVDGIDVVIADFFLKRNIIKHNLIAHQHYVFPLSIRKKIFEAMDIDKSSSKMLCELNFELAYLYANAVKKILKKINIKKEDILAIGSHGQTIYHIPRDTKENGKKLIPSTLQIGDGSVIAELTGITTVSDFRTRDIAAGGHGAPLVPFADFHIFSNPKKNIVLQNIGGISNCTFLKAHGKIDDVIAFDNGPGNVMIDFAISKLTYGKMKYDKDGRFAKMGKINEAILKNILAHPFFNKKPPKSTGREMFGAEFVDKIIHKFNITEKNIYDFIATLTYFTAITIAESYKKFIMKKHKIDEAILSGGGAYNKTLVEMIRNLLPHLRIKILEELGFISQAKEALCFALLAYAAMHKIPNNVPSATGAKKHVILGKITL